MVEDSKAVRTIIESINSQNWKLDAGGTRTDAI